MILGSLYVTAGAIIIGCLLYTSHTVACLVLDETQCFVGFFLGDAFAVNGLYKIDDLTQEEYDEIKEHINYSVKILEDIKQLKDVVEIIKCHHENYDGSGYPAGLRGEEIPVGARIIAVGDAFDSIISDRVYRQKNNYEEALEEIKKGSGSHFDPVIVRAFCECYEHIVQTIRE